MRALLTARTVSLGGARAPLQLGWQACSGETRSATLSEVDSSLVGQIHLVPETAAITGEGIS